MSPNVEFNLREFAEEYDRQFRRPWRSALGLIGTFTGGIGALGAYLILRTLAQGGADALHWAAYTTLLVCGFGVTAVLGWIYHSMSEPASHLTVTPDSLVLGSLGGSAEEIRWNQLDKKIRISDWRGLPGNSKVPQLRRVDYVLFGRWIQRPAALPAEAAQLIVERASQHGLIISGALDAPPRQGRARVVTIQPKERA